MMGSNILLAGESWVSYTTHTKGFDPFYSTEYATGHTYLKNALEAKGHSVFHLPNHLAATEFPYTMEELKQYDCVILSDIGSNTLLLPPETFKEGRRMPNRCQLIKDYVLQGGALIMIGGYLTFTGIDGKGRWGATAVQDVLPVELMPYDDRREHPEGIVPRVEEVNHPVLRGVDLEWPFFLGYNQARPRSDAQVLMTIKGDPFLAVAQYGKGKSAVFASDCAPHWGPREFFEWESFPTLWDNLVCYAAG